MVHFNGTFGMGIKRLYMVLVQISALTAIVLLAGCSANTWVYDSAGNILYHIKTDGKAKHRLVTEGFEVDTDSKQEPLLKFDLSANKMGS